MGNGDSKEKDQNKKAQAHQKDHAPGAPRAASPTAGQQRQSSTTVANDSQTSNKSGGGGMPPRQDSNAMGTPAQGSAASLSPATPHTAAVQNQGSYQEFQQLKTQAAVQLTSQIVSQIAFNWTQAPIDKGGFSSIYAGKYYNTDVVVKHLAIRDQSELEMFNEELKVLINPDFIHANLVPLIAYCTERPALIFQHLKPMKQDRMERLPLDVRESIALDAVRGIAHMHSKGFVHRDLKPDNVLMEFDPNRVFVKALISDMGCARPITQPIAPFGTMLFMDNHLLALMAQHQQGVIVKPECYNDVYSLALTIACILTARPAHQKQDFDWMISEIETHDFARGQLLRSMIQDNQLARPTAAQVAQQLELLKGQPLKPRQGAHQPTQFVQQQAPPQQQFVHQQQQYQQQPGQPPVQQGAVVQQGQGQRKV